MSTLNNNRPTIALLSGAGKFRNDLFTVDRNSISSSTDILGHIDKVTANKPSLSKDGSGLSIYKASANKYGCTDLLGASTSDITTDTFVRMYNGISPDGKLNATKVCEAETTARHIFYNSNGFSSSEISDNETLVYSVFIKAAELTKVQVWLRNRASVISPVANFNTSTGLASRLGDGINTGSTYIGDGWYRMWVSMDAGVGTTTCTARVYLDDGSIYLGTGRGIYLWGHQFETGEFPSSYIPSTNVFTSRGGTADVGTYIDENGLMHIAADNTERFSYGYLDGKLHYIGRLDEPSRENLCQASNSFAAPDWSANSTVSTVTTGAALGPDGNLSATQLDGLTGEALIDVLSGAPSINSRYSVSIWVRADINLIDSQIKLGIRFTGGASPSTKLAQIKVTKEWQRFSYSFLVDRSDYTGAQFILQFDSDETIYVFGAQAEIGAYSTSYIPTSGSSVTRSGDVYSEVSNTKEAEDIDLSNYLDTINNSGGAFIVHIENTFEDVYSGILELTNDGDSETVKLYKDSSNNIKLEIVNDGTTSTITSLNANGDTKIVFTYGESEVSMLTNLDNRVMQTVSTTLPKSLSKLKLGRTSDGYLNGNLIRFIYFPTEFTYEQMKRYIK